MIAAGAATATDGDPIASGDWWPAIDPKDARATLRLDATVDAVRLRAALVEAVANVTHALGTWATEQALLGVANLSQTSGVSIDGQHVNVHRYHRAVYATAMANLQERYRSFDATADGHQRADTLSNPIDEHRRDARWAISDIMGLSRTTVELI